MGKHIQNNFAETVQKLRGAAETVVQTTDTARNMIYRYIDVIKNSYALLEAIHFEVFAPGMLLNHFSIFCSQKMCFWWRTVSQMSAQWEAFLTNPELLHHVSDRPELRFIAIPFDRVRGKALEGDYVLISGLELLPESTFAIDIGTTLYPVVWTAPRGTAGSSLVDRTDTLSI